MLVYLGLGLMIDLRPDSNVPLFASDESFVEKVEDTISSADAGLVEVSWYLDLLID